MLRRLRRQAKPGEFDLSTLRFALSGAEPVDPSDVEDLIDAGKPFGMRADAILPAYGMAETTLAVSFSKCGPDWWSTRWMPTCCRTAPCHPGDQGQHPDGWPPWARC